jgi:exoribonuclease R
MKIVPGILLCNGPVMKIIKKGVVMRKFIPNDTSIDSINIRCRKVQNSPNEYGLANLTDGTYAGKIGFPGNMDDEKLYLLYCHNVKHKKHRYTEKEYPDLTPDRIDLQELYTASVDPYGSTDIDDALSIQFVDNKYIVYIHIADVTSFVKFNSDIDLYGRKKSETMYLCWKQENMYPNSLVEKMSLLEKTPRRAFTVEITIDNELNIESKMYKSIIKVNRNLSYDKFSQKKPDNKLLYDLGKTLYNSKKILKHNDDLYDSHKMIEVYMIMCNSQVAEKIKSIGKHKPICRSYDGIEISTNNPIKKIINQYKAEKAEYTLESKIHKQIGNSLYSHFTSPIRRYVDTLTHRILFSSITDNELEFDKSKLSDYIEYINTSHTNIQRVNRNSQLLIKLNEYYTKQPTFNSTGYVVYITESYIIVYDPEHDIRIPCPLYSYKIKDKLDIEYDETKITITKKNTEISVTFKLEMEVNLKVAITFLETKLNRKIIGQLTNPNPMSLFDFNMDFSIIDKIIL